VALAVVVGLLLVVVALEVMRSRINDWAAKRRAEGQDSLWTRNVGSRAVTGWRRIASLSLGGVAVVLLAGAEASYGALARGLLASAAAAVAAAYGIRLAGR